MAVSDFNTTIFYDLFDHGAFASAAGAANDKSFSLSRGSCIIDNFIYSGRSSLDLRGGNEMVA
ncbi:hypothetical protein D9M71_539420 [compost metagenome]